MLRIGITGGIGSGKSTVCGVFACLGVPIYNADEEAKELYNTLPELKEKIILNFGEEMYTNGWFNKEKMKALVFNDPLLLDKLNKLVHPYVKLHAEDWMNKQNAVYAIKESALLIETNAHLSLDQIILVSCPEELRIQRVMHREQVNREEVLKRIKQQLREEEKRPFCHHEVVNDNVHAIIPQVLKLHALFSA